MSAVPDSLPDVLKRSRALVNAGMSVDEVVQSSVVPEVFRESVKAQLHTEQNIVLEPVGAIIGNLAQTPWLHAQDRSHWHYWPAYRELLIRKEWKLHSLRSLDDASDRILNRLAPPTNAQFDVRGLVLGHIQSGKTANFTAVISKAADCGYRLIIVLSGIDNGLRRQTNRRLKKELVGVEGRRADAVPLPPMGRRWHEFTTDALEGDFNPGLVNHASLQGSQPVLLVVKKNASVLRKLKSWLSDAPVDVRNNLPLLVIDDEADQASVDTRGTYRPQDALDDEVEQEDPSIINGLIRELLGLFQRRAYVAYTATPFANILIPHDAIDDVHGADLYPNDFIIDLPKPDGYFGAEEFFGRMDSQGGESDGGLDVMRAIEQRDIEQLNEGVLPTSLIEAMEDFVLAGAALMTRRSSAQPATMLVHTSQRILEHSHLKQRIDERVKELRDEWRYQRTLGLRERLKNRWEEVLRPRIRSSHAERDVDFEGIEDALNVLLQSVKVLELNSSSEASLDYETDPSLKAIIVGGNKLSRGLTLEGLLCSYFVRRTTMYDTLLQMGRWFGFRGGYEDLLRVYTTRELASWFSALSFVEYRLREDIAVYEREGLTPREVGLRIWQHPEMQVTSASKRRFVSTSVSSESFRLTRAQTFRFPLENQARLWELSNNNRDAVRTFLGKIGATLSSSETKFGPIWMNVPVIDVLEFFARFRVDRDESGIAMDSMASYVRRRSAEGELTSWTVAVRGREELDSGLGTADWGLPSGPVRQISRTRLACTDSLGVITSPGDEALGLSESQIKAAREEQTRSSGGGRSIGFDIAARMARDPANGLLLLYPISRFSRVQNSRRGPREPLFDDPHHRRACDLIGLAVSFPDSAEKLRKVGYIVGTVPPLSEDGDRAC